MDHSQTLTLIQRIPTLPLFFTLFCITYMVGKLVFRRWSVEHRPDATSCFISLLHGTPAVFLAVAALRRSPAASFASGNTEFQSLVLDFSIAYFIVDLLHYIILLPPDYTLFIGHHVSTLFVFVTCRYYVLHGAFALLVLLILAEITSLFQNLWTLAGLKKEEVEVAERVYRLLSAPFYLLYTATRVVMGPLFYWKMSLFYLSGKAEEVIPKWVSASWIVVVGGAIGVSILWIRSRWVEYFAERKALQKQINVTNMKKVT